MSTSFNISQLGIIAQGEYTHPFSPDHPDWNKSCFSTGTTKTPPSLVSCQFHGEHEGIVSPGWFECNRNITDNTVEHD